MVHDEKAEELERKGLWRRAAERWGGNCLHKPEIIKNGSV
ncbi:TPA: PerC family transcriptional regulator [Escherichia coli]